MHRLKQISKKCNLNQNRLWSIKTKMNINNSSKKFRESIKRIIAYPTTPISLLHLTTISTINLINFMVMVMVLKKSQKSKKQIVLLIANIPIIEVVIFLRRKVRNQKVKSLALAQISKVQ